MSSVPEKYLEGLSKSDKKKKIKNIKKTKELLKQGKQKEAEELAKKRPTTKSKKTSSYTERFKMKFPDTPPESRKFTIATGIPKKIQTQIIKRGMGAYLSSGSRASVSSPRQWGIARLYSFYFNKGRTFDKDLAKNINFK